MSYPKWKYHAKLEAKIVHSEDEEKALGKEWAESPAEFQKPAGSYVEHMEAWPAKSEEKKPKKAKKDKAE